MNGRVFFSVIVPALVWVVAVGPVDARAQNDWQFPDPHFGLLQFGQAHAPANDRQYRGEIAASTQPRAASTGSVRPRRTRWLVRKR